MRTILLLAIAAAALGITAPSRAQPYYGPGMMGGYGGGGYGPGYMMGPGYGGGYMMGPGYGGGYGHGPGMMYGYGPDGRSYRGGQAYRGKRLCWHQTDADKNTGYYAPCR
jgi:hypothetical protein